MRTIPLGAAADSTNRNNGVLPNGVYAIPGLLARLAPALCTLDHHRVHAVGKLLSTPLIQLNRLLLIAHNSGPTRTGGVDTMMNTSASLSASECWDMLIQA